MSTTQEASDKQQYLTFKIAEEVYAIGILRVKEIIEYDAVTKVPQTPPWIRGVINLRGSVVPVIDLAVKFGLEPSEPTKWTCIIFVELELDGDNVVMGVVADAVEQVVDLGAEDIEPSPAFGTNVRVDFLLGMGKLGREFVLILDIDLVLSASELLIANAAVLEEESTEEGGEAPVEQE